MKVNFSSLPNGANLSRLFKRIGGQNPLASNPLGDAKLFHSATHLRTVGDGTVDGVSVTEYAGTLDFSALTKLIPGGERGMLRSLPASLLGSRMPFQVWIDRQHHIRKLVMSLRARGVTMTVTVNVTSVNKPVHIVLPPASQVTVLPRI